MMEQVIREAHAHICISENGFHSIQVESKEEIDFVLEIDENINASIFLTYIGTCMKVKGCIRVGKNAQARILCWNKVQQSFVCEQEIDMKAAAEATIAYGELEENDAQYDIYAKLKEQGSTLAISSAALSASKKHFQVQCIHEVAHTSSHMEHYAVVKENGDYCMKATGKVEKGAYESATHQITRVLTLAEKQKSEVVPLLFIDENDVKASHATSLGQPDENQLYYLQTRGLSREQALGLLMIGYIMPMKNIIQQEELQEKLQSEIEMKVGLYV